MPHGKSKFKLRWSSIPDGYLEDCDKAIASAKAPTKASPPAYAPAAVTLSVLDNVILNEEQGYDIKFTSGMMEGFGLEVQANGRDVLVRVSGSYRFEVCGTASAFSDVDAKLIFFSPSISDDIRPFTETVLSHTDSGYNLRGISTILPLEAEQVLSTRLIPNTSESVIVHSGFRLMIHRVA